MKRSPARANDARGAAEPSGDRDDLSPRLRVDTVKIGASGVATIAAGGSSFLLRTDQLEELGGALPEPGQELDAEDEGRLRLAAEAHEAERRGLALLARAEQSSFLLAAKLGLRGFGQKAVRLALERLKSLGFLDDRRYAEAFAASRLARRSEGPRSLEAALRSRGIDGELARELCASLFAEEGRPRSLLRALERELKRAGGDREKASQRLRKLGYKPGEIAEALAAQGREGGVES